MSGEIVPVDTTRATKGLDPRSSPGFAALPAYDRACALIAFQKLCVRNVLQHFDSTYNPIAWKPMGYGEPDVWAQLDERDEARFDVAIGVCCLASAREDLRGSDWHWDTIFAGESEAGCFDVMCGTTFSDRMVSFEGFYGWNYVSSDPKDLDTSDAKILAMATSELALGAQVKHKMTAPIVAVGRSPGFERVLGSHGVARDLMGAWKEDPERELARALALKPGAGQR
jgi:hypothetical protein